MYLKNFASESGDILSYSLLVPRPEVRTWNQFSVAGTGYHKNLYTRIEQGEETDDIEKWLSSDFESPAVGPLRKVIREEQLTKSEMHALVRFLAAQIVRTPAFLIENLPFWNELTPRILSETMADVREKLRLAKLSGQEIVVRDTPGSQLFPLRVVRKDLPKEGKVRIRAEVVVGRGLWFHTMKHTLTKTLNVLHQHNWTILTAPEGLDWFTSDDPVVRLNYRSEDDYDFKGGWGRPRTDIFLPLSPRHLLFTEVGAAPYRRETPSRYRARQIRKFIAEHAHRRIYSSAEDDRIPKLRPRVVNFEQFQREKAEWKQWYEVQTQAERSLTRGS